MKFKIDSTYKPTGDQPLAIEQLVQGIQEGDPAQVLLGVTGSGKTFTMANVIAQLDRPALVLTHNKTLTAQLYGEFKGFFPDNADGAAKLSVDGRRFTLSRPKASLHGMVQEYGVEHVACGRFETEGNITHTRQFF